MLVVGLTGGAATGKSTVARILAGLGVPVVDADQAARVVVEPGRPALARIVEAFGPTVLAGDGTLDRSAMRRRIVEDAGARRTLEAITHPAIRDRFVVRLGELADKGFVGIVIYDAAVLIESGNHKNLDRLVVVITDDATQMVRLHGRDGTDEAENQRKIASQMPLAEKAKLADYVIDNSGSREATAEQVRRVYAALMAELESRAAV